MKKIISLCLSVVMIAVAFGIIVPVSANPNPVFSLDFSGDELSNSVSGSGASIHLAANRNWNVQTANGVDFVTFTGGPGGGFGITGDAVFNQDNLTIETWINFMQPTTPPALPQWNRLFGMFGTEGEGSHALDVVVVRPADDGAAHANTVVVRPQGGAPLDVRFDAMPHYGEWVHLVVTRSFSGNNWTANTYVNGQRIDSASATGTGRKDETGLAFWAGRGLGGNPVGFRISMGEFNVFNTALTAAQVTARYNAGANTFGNLPSIAGGAGGGGQQAQPQQPQGEPGTPGGAVQQEAVFDLDFSNWDRGSRAVSNRASSDLTAAAAPNAEAVLFQAANAAGNNVQFLEILGLGQGGGIRINGNAFRNQEGISIETWVNVPTPDFGQWNRMFGIFGANTGYTSLEVLSVSTQNPTNTNHESLTFRPTGGDGNNYVSMASHYDNWIHLVVTRSFAGGTTTFNGYINGQRIEDLSGIGGPRKNEDQLIFWIGRGWGGLARGESIAFGSFRVYNRELAASEVTTKFNNSRATFEGLGAATAVSGMPPQGVIDFPVRTFGGTGGGGTQPPPQQDGIGVTLNGTRLNFTDADPIIHDNRTMVPMRAIFEALGMIVEWDDATRTAIGTRGVGLRIEIPIDSTTATVNGEAVTLDVPAMLHNGRTMVPVRFIAEASGANVDWDQATQTVIITQ